MLVLSRQSQGKKKEKGKVREPEQELEERATKVGQPAAG
jgi:hypothetical protein